LLQWKSTITYFECVFAAVCIHHAIRMPRIVIGVLSGSSTFFPFCLINGTIFEKKM